MKKVNAVVVVLMAAAIVSAVAADKVLVNTNAERVAIDGFDAVGFFETGKPTQGLPSISVIHEGAVYFFATEANRTAFLKNPGNYAPQFGGYCPVALSQDVLMAGNPNQFRVVDGKLYLLCDLDAATRFDTDAPGIKEKAEKKWYEKIEVYGTPYTYGVTRQK